MHSTTRSSPLFSGLRHHDIIMPVRIEIPDGSAAVRQVRAGTYLPMTEV